MNINSKLMKIRNKIKLGKDYYNPSGGFMFRNAEAMLGYIKPICEEEGITFFFKDDIVNIGNYNYIKAEIIVVDTEDGEELRTSSFAREDDGHPMAAPMISGAASSYAHKYALQNIFAIDDGKLDPDARGAMETAGPEANQEDEYPQESGLKSRMESRLDPRVASRIDRKMIEQPDPYPAMPMPANQGEWGAPVMPQMPQMENEAPTLPPMNQGEWEAPAMPSALQAENEIQALPPVNQGGWEAPVAPEINDPYQTSDPAALIVSSPMFNYSTGIIEVKTNYGTFARNPFRHEWTKIPDNNVNLDELYEKASNKAGCSLDYYSGSYR